MLQPMGNRVIVQVAKKRDDDILIPESAQTTRDQERATVIAVGPGKRYLDGNLHPVDLKEGDVVYFNPFGGSKMKHEGKEYVILTDEDILAKEIK